MEFLEIIVALSSMITSIMTLAILIIGFYPAFRSLKQQERSLRFGVYYQVIEMMEKTREERRNIQDRVQPGKAVGYFNTLKDEKQKNAFDEVARTFDKLGLLVKNGVVPLDFVMDFYARPIVITWHRVREYVEEERKERGQPGHMKKFEELALLAKDHRDKYHKGEETFESDANPPNWPKTWKT